MRKSSIAPSAIQTLFDSAANGGALMDSVSFGPQIADFSIGRLSDGSWGLCQPTFGAANVPQATGDIDLLKINEWLASGSAAMPDDFVELYNPDAAPVAMGGLYLSDAPDGSPARYQIAALSYIAAGGFFAFGVFGFAVGGFLAGVAGHALEPASPTARTTTRAGIRCRAMVTFAGGAVPTS